MLLGVPRSAMWSCEARLRGEGLLGGVAIETATAGTELTLSFREQETAALFSS